MRAIDSPHGKIYRSMAKIFNCNNLLDHICHMYGVVYSQPDFPTYTLISTSGQIYQPPLPFLEPLSQTSSYLKISTISCSGCDVRRTFKRHDFNTRILHLSF
jgi:hypothetical protein